MLDIVKKSGPLPADESLHRFTEKQLTFWNYLYKHAKNIGPVQRSIIDPFKIPDLLPNIWMADLLFDDNRQLIDMRPRLMGTKIVALYGERTNENIISGTGEKALKTKFPNNYKRLQMALDLMLKINKPVFGEAENFSPQRNYLSIKGLMVPAYRNSDTVNLVVGLNEGQVEI